MELLEAPQNSCFAQRRSLGRHIKNSPTAAVSTQEPGRDSAAMDSWCDKATREKRSKQHTTQVHYHCSYNRTSAATQSFINPRALLSLIVILVTLNLFCGTASAQRTHGDRRRSAAIPIDEVAPAWKGPSLLIVDKRPAPVPPLMPVVRRDGTPTTSSKRSKTTLSTDPSASPSDSPLPRPFDSALSNNFTNPCQAFFKKLLSNDTVYACHPFSLLLQTSSGFFDASKSYVRITNVLEASCNVNASICLNTMNEFARMLKQNDMCGVDYANDNPQVLQAYNGLIAYQPLYQASCLRNEETGSYCFSDAVTNTTSTTDAYPYYLPLGATMPGGARPTCSSCLQDSMAIFSSFGGNSSQPISKTYNSAAQQMDLYCGPTFVNKTATPLKAAAPGTSISLTPSITLFIMLFLYFLR